MDRYLEHFLWNCTQVNATRLHWWLVNFVQVMKRCHQATSHCLSQYWPRSVSPYGVARPIVHDKLSPESVTCHYDHIHFYPSTLRPMGYCRCLRPSVRPSVRPYDHACPRVNSKKIFQNFLKLGWNILWVNISDEFDDGYRSSLNMRIIDQKWLWHFFNSWSYFFK